MKSNFTSKGFTEDLVYFIDKINSGDNFALLRYGDGERMLMQGEPVGSSTQASKVDKWSFSGGKTIISEDLIDSCLIRKDNFYYGISCSCCDPKSKAFYLDKMSGHNLTYANIFVNSNYKNFIHFINSIDRDVVLISNKAATNAHFPFNVVDSYFIENNCVEWYEEFKEEILKEVIDLCQRNKNRLFLISAGPLSEIFIHKMFLNNEENCYLDVGSSIDVLIHRKITRPYQISGNYYSNKKCKL